MKLTALWVAAGLLLAGAAAPAFAGDDIANHVISVPVPSAYRVDGQQGTPEIRKDSGVQGGQALRVHVAAKGANPWDISLAVPVNKPIKAGDKLILAFWARLVEGPGGASTATLPYCAVQLAKPPYSAVISGSVDIGTEWKMYSVTGTADKAYKAGDVGIGIQLATAKQVIDFGPVFLIALPPEAGGGN